MKLRDYLEQLVETQSLIRTDQALMKADQTAIKVDLAYHIKRTDLLEAEHRISTAKLDSRLVPVEQFRMLSIAGLKVFGAVLTSSLASAIVVKLFLH